MNFKQRILPLLAYYKEYGTIRNIQQKDKYNYNGKEHNIGILINNLKTQYKLRNANEEERKKSRYLPLKDEEVELLESIGMLWAARRNI